MHNGWKKICRSVCRKMDVFVQRRWLCNLITSVASVADSGIMCSCSVSITCLNFVALPAARDGDLGRGGEILAQLLTRGLPLVGCLLHQRAAGGVSPGQGVHGGRGGGGGGGCRGAGSATPGERLRKSRGRAAQWSHWAAPAARSFARSHRNLGLGCMATAERRRDKTEIKIDPPPLRSPSPSCEHGVVLTSPSAGAEAEPVPLAQTAPCLSGCEQPLLAALAGCCLNVLQYSGTDVGRKYCQIQQLRTPVTFRGTEKLVF